MRAYLSSLFQPENRKLTLILIGSGIVLIIISLIIGIGDNPPGLTLIFVGLILLALAFVHLWSTARPFVILFIVSVVGGVLFAILHNVFYAFGEMWAQYQFVKAVMEVLHAGAFIIAILICPVGAFVGFFGGIVTYFLKQNPKKTAE